AIVLHARRQDGAATAAFRARSVGVIPARGGQGVPLVEVSHGCPPWHQVIHPVSDSSRPVQPPAISPRVAPGLQLPFPSVPTGANSPRPHANSHTTHCHQACPNRSPSTAAHSSPVPSSEARVVCWQE